MAAVMLAAGLTASAWAAIGAVGALIVALAVALNGAQKDRAERVERARTEETATRQEIRELKIGLFGDETGMNPGFVRQQLAHNARVDEELRTDNGGGTIKGSLKILRTQLGEAILARQNTDAKVDRLAEAIEASNGGAGKDP